ncbi:MAG: decaprenylphospho-beta-D-erythro-pentofuranosid-2-ulose 2-reductase [Frankiales bacterium]|nr:decaprenylphospho-beta-D-erythro-pentofuranosid-2-ulose 2-reductase [Frankiales bacterium]
MSDALHRPSSVLLLGGTSDIGLATVRALASPALRRVVLAARPSPARDAAVEQLTEAGVPEVCVRDFDAADTASHAQVLDSVFAGPDVDVVVVAFGVLGEQRELEEAPDLAVELARVNYLGGVSSCLLAAQRLRRQGHGSIVVLSSVAGDRPRRSNFVYGSSKAGLDSLARGLADSLRGTGVHVLVVRPGFVRSSMTEHLDPAPLAVTPADVAAAVVDGLRRGSTVVYVPRVMRLVMTGLRHVPGPIFRRLPV